MMESMMKLPDDMFRQELLPYLTVHDIVNLDNAYMNHIYRPQLMGKISSVILMGFKITSLIFSSSWDRYLWFIHALSRFTILSNVKYGNNSCLNISSGSFSIDSIIHLSIFDYHHHLSKKPHSSWHDRHIMNIIFLTMYGIQWIVHLDILVRSERRDR